MVAIAGLLFAIEAEAFRWWDAVQNRYVYEESSVLLKSMKLQKLLESWLYRG
jgi:hypothetical protein